MWNSSPAQAGPAFPDSLRDWSDDDRIAWLFTRGLNLSGNLVFGDGPLQREPDSRPFRELAATNLQVARDFVAPLLPVA